MKARVGTWIIATGFLLIGDALFVEQHDHGTVRPIAGWIIFGYFVLTLWASYWPAYRRREEEGTE